MAGDGGERAGFCTRRRACQSRDPYFLLSRTLRASNLVLRFGVSAAAAAVVLAVPRHHFKSFEDAVKQYIAVESDCIKIMAYIRAKEVEIEVEAEMAAKFTADAAAHVAANEVLRRKMAQVDVLRKVRPLGRTS